MKNTERYRVLGYTVIVAVVAGALWAGIRYDVSQQLMNRGFVLLGWGDAGAFESNPNPGAVAGAEEPRGDVALDPRRRQLIGLQTVLVEEQVLDRTIRATGIVKPDERRLVDVNVRLAGWVRQLRVDYVGRPVRQGDPLFTLYSPELASTEQEYLLARASRDELGGGAVSEARVYADRLVEASERRLERWGVSREQIARIAERRDTSGEMALRSPASGYVVEKMAVEGMHVEPGQTLYRIADLSVVWLEASIYEQDLSLVGMGQQASITLEALPGRELTGRVVYVSPSLVGETRTATVRFEFANGSAELKPGMFATATLHRSLPSGLVVPENSVLDSGARQFVFVDADEGHFEPREIKTGARANGQVQVTSGVRSGERVASSAVFLIDSESQLRGALQGFASTPGSAQAPQQAPSTAGVAVTFRSSPDPPQVGENVFAATVKTADGAPVDDAQVDVTFFMPAMPSMSMPAMRQQFRLARVEPGNFRGSAHVTSGGRWQVTVAVTRDGRRIGSLDTALVAH